MACWRDEESRIHIVTTLPALKLPNGDFEEWNFSEEGVVLGNFNREGLPRDGIAPTDDSPREFWEICRETPETKSGVV